jgi:hypothetical protein
MSNLTGTPGGIHAVAERVGDEFLLRAPDAEGRAVDTVLRREFAARMERDQAVRNEAMSGGLAGGGNLDPDLGRRWEAIDVANTAWVSRVIDRYGWPGYELVGKEGELAAFLLVQHADRQPQFQESCLVPLEAAVNAGDADPGHLAYLTDRVRVAKGEPQVYGTQIGWKDGKPQPHPIEDPERVDERRAAVGLGTLAEYMVHFQELAGGKDGD